MIRMAVTAWPPNGPRVRKETTGTATSSTKVIDFENVHTRDLGLASTRLAKVSVRVTSSENKILVSTTCKEHLYYGGPSEVVSLWRSVIRHPATLTGFASAERRSIPARLSRESIRCHSCRDIHAVAPG